MHKVTLLTPLQIGDLTLPNRVLMAPLTRMRATDDRLPTDMMATYYEQRASAGLIITEATIIMPEGAGYVNTPGLYTDEQVAGWRTITDAVHAAGGRIFVQLWHTGRVSHPSFQPQGALPVAPSAIAIAGELMTPVGRRPYETPRALETDEIGGLVAKFAEAAQRAQDAGFDGVEIHGANGYLIDQFLRDGTNKRTDRYGGSLANRARFLLEIVDAVKEIWPVHRIGVRLSPSHDHGHMVDSNPYESFTYFAEALAQKDIGYIHIREANDTDRYDIVPAIRDLYKGVLIVNEGYNKTRALDALESDRADAVAFGALFIANPDLPIRFRLDAPLNEVDPSTFYGGGAKGYVDYPALALSVA